MPVPHTSRHASVPIFVCHSRHDELFSRLFVAYLRLALGAGEAADVFCSGESRDDQTAAGPDRAIREAARRPICIAIMSTHALDDPDVSAQLEAVLRARGRVIVALIEGSGDIKQQAVLPGTWAVIDFVTQPYDDAMRALLETLTDSSMGALVSPAAHQVAVASDERSATRPDPLSAAEAALARWDWGGAIAAAEAALDRVAPDDHDASRASLLGVLAAALGRVGEWERARDTAKAGLDLDPNHPRLWRALGHALAGLDCLEVAVDAFDQARAHTPIDDLATRLEILGERYRYAVQLLRRKKLDLNAGLLRRSPQDTSLLSARLGLLLDLGRDAEALEVSRALTALPTLTVARAITQWLTRARVARRLDPESSEALAAVQGAMRLAPDDPAIQRACAAIVAPRAPDDYILQDLLDREFQWRVLDAGEVLLPAVCAVPEGECMLGSDPTHDHEAFSDEKPQRSTVLHAFEIGRYPVTVAEYAQFVAAGQYAPLNWHVQLRNPRLPVRNVSWFDAMAYCAWLSRVTGERWRLPTEDEWEKAARWDVSQQHARIYPWGDVFDGQRCNVQSGGVGGPTSIGSYPDDASPCGARDMAGNVWEWTSSPYAPRGLAVAVREAFSAPSLVDRVLRGGSWNHPERLARGACRGHRVPLGLTGDTGFRVLHDPI